MAKRKRNRSKERILNLIANKTRCFIQRRDAQRHDRERSSRLIELLYINGMLK
ncbi:hypothetical protein [Dehalobacter sp. TeCB1]|uniref:hypothetical protein n=1 Tax=Dehalobacter sp. TeCB1 TaxID=1843715 RepID=UPI00159F1F84|nr:hypothetical protein [Dehalobacter sp. TeCB1]